MGTTTLSAALVQTKVSAGKTALHPRGTNHFYAPELDALRFGAFLMVFCRHVTSQFAAVHAKVSSQLHTVMTVVAPHVETASTTSRSIDATSKWSFIQGFTQSLDFGVCLFFFLSSFLITRLLILEQESTGSIGIRDFYVRRSLRIWPLYFTFIAAVVLLSHWIPVLHVDRSRVIVCIFFVANWAAVFHGWSSLAIQPLWSISVEEQFYVFWPWIARGGKKMILLSGLVLGLLSLGTLTYLGSQKGIQVTATWPNTLVQMLFFAGGACTAVLSRPELQRLARWVRFSLIACGLIFWATASVRFHIVRTESPDSASLVFGYLFVLLGTSLIFTGVAGWGSTSIPRWAIHLGRISYGMYVFHVVSLILAEKLLLHPLLRLLPAAANSTLIATGVVALAGFALTIAAALLSYRFLERPFLLLKKHFSVVSSRPD